MKKAMPLISILFLLLTFHVRIQPAQAEGIAEAQQGGEAGLAQELTNPLADLMTIPILMNYDRDIGTLDDGWKLQTNIQPVIPFRLTEDWNLISRTILPVTYQKDIFPGTGSQFGLGDTSLSLFCSPKKPTSGGVIWGAGPVVLLPTAAPRMPPAHPRSTMAAATSPPTTTGEWERFSV